MTLASLPLARDQFYIPDPELIYLDGNSLGRPLKASIEAVSQGLNHQWGGQLIRSWNESWIDLPRQCAESLGVILGAEPDQIMVGDQTTLNLFKVASAALGMQANRKVVVTDSLQFPSDQYVLQGLGGEVRTIESQDDLTVSLDQIREALTDDVGVLCLSLVSFKSGFKYSLREVCDLARSSGVLTIWDLSHAAGAVEVGLDEAGADFAIGCTYKYLNGGPGSPGYLYVNRRHHSAAVSPIWGWFGHESPFAFDREYRPGSGVSQFQVGTPPVLSMQALAPALAQAASVGARSLEEGGRLLTELFLELVEPNLSAWGMSLGTPRNPSQRGSHVSLLHPEARLITQALIDQKVIPDFRSPDVVRFGFCPLYTSPSEVERAIEILTGLMEGRSYRNVVLPTGPVT